jgi:hypothetical protein
MGDVAVAEALKERLGGDDELVLCPLLPARQLVALARRAGAIISTRYHPIVFGLAGGVPCLAVYQDHYTSVKLTGALAHAGLSGWSVPLEALATDLPGDVFDELWTRRAELREHLATVTEEWPRAQHDHWDEVWSSLVDPALALPIRPGEARLPRPLEPELAQLATLNAVAAKYMSASEVAESRSREMLLEAEHYAIDLQSALSAKSADLDALHAYLDDVQQDREVAQEGLAVAYTRIDLLHAQLAELDLRRATVEADNIALLDDIRLAEHSAESARTLVAQSRQKVAQLRDEAAQLRDEAARAGQQAARSCEELVAAQSELSAAQIALVSCEARADQQSALIEAIDATKIMRWTRRLRNVYASSRRLLGRGPGR